MKNTPCIDRLALAVLLLGGIALLSLPASAGLSKRLKVSGEWDGRELHAHVVKSRDVRKDPLSGTILGRIVSIDWRRRLLTIGPLGIHWTADTDFDLVNASGLYAGQFIKVSGKLDQAGVLQARSIKPSSGEGSRNRMQLIGHMSFLQLRPDGTTEVRILGVPTLIPQSLTSLALQLTHRQDTRRPADQLTFDLAGRPVVIGGEVDISPRYQRGVRLDPERDDERLRLDVSAQLEAFYTFSSNVALFLELQADTEFELYRDSGADSNIDRRLKRGETWLFWGDIRDSGVSLQLGNQNFQDIREWWWDENLDALRLYYTRPTLHLELAVAEQQVRLASDESGIDARDQDVSRLLGLARWKWSTHDALSLFLLSQRDASGGDRIGDRLGEGELDERDADLTWLGLRAAGKFDIGKRQELEYWFDSAWMRGSETLIDVDESPDGGFIVTRREHRDIDGWAFDIGATLETEWRWKPYFTASYAMASEDFRQTGLQDNNDKFGAGVTRFRYYGELLRPELANLGVLSLGVGIPFWKASSVDLMFHDYRQTSARPFLHGARVRARPTGESRDIGQALDLVIGIEEWRHVEIELTLGVFHAGAAFGESAGENAYNATLKFVYNF
ncbi:MAG TPA: hypothetical protein ENJ21_06060 [Chromatiaceae bacterium]|nr:hypothetical protein [Chromatiaceae bacterium]